MTRRSFLQAAGAAAAATAVAPAADLDWTKVEAETLEHFTALLKIDTSSPPGNETLVARYVQQVLERESIPVKFLAVEQNRGNVVARLKGSGSKPPILLMGHSDVVGVQREKWSVDPFAATRKDGYIYARGATDDKDNVVAGLMAMLLLKRQATPLERDVIFLAEAGEEGTVRVGIEFIVNQHWPEIECEFALAEGGSGLKRDGKPVFMSVSTSEKAARGIRLLAKGTAGHGSTPVVDNAVVRLANAVAKLGSFRTPIRLNETTRTYFQRLAEVTPPDKSAHYRAILDPRTAPEAERFLAVNEVWHHSMLRTSLTPTMLKAGFRSNVIPSEAEAYVDIRALPDENVDNLLRDVRAAIDDPAVEVVRSTTPPRPMSPPSPLNSAMYRTLESVQKRFYPGAVTIPSMLTAATDLAYLRGKGVHAYGIGPLIEERDQNVGGPHSDDERIEEKALHAFVRFQWEVVREIAAKAA
ncbi:MAG TPA: M20/M25/M40 family metallo-hydrolase [Bryobacteraceae bacterium]|nr:M20/M25/M40 family metallo-hydrolase [Bryobacteraceae bacterium]